VRHPVLADPRVRRALTLAIDRRAIVDVLLRGEGDVPASPILAPLPEHDPAIVPWPADRAAAAKLLDEAGFPEKKGRRFALRLMVQAGSAIKRDAAVMLQRDLAAVGVAVEIVPVENSAFYRTLAERAMDAWIGGWRASARVDMTEMLHGSACSAEGNNFGCWSDPGADALAAAARDELDDARRTAGWRAWERTFHEQQPYTMLYRTNVLAGVRARVHGTESLTANDVLEGVETWTVDPR
jgi:ABC-type transport system substrate-binding protein